MRTILSIAALLVLAALWFGPLPELARSYFSAHMAMHMGVVAMAAPLLSFALAGTRLDAVRNWPEWFPPVPLSLVELVVVWVWHAPALHHAARNSTAGLVAEQGSFLIAGVLVWLSAFGGGDVKRRERSGAGVAALLLTSMHMTLLGALLALTTRSLYIHTASCVPDDPHFTALDDQHLGGAIMLLIGGAAYLAGGLWLTRTLLSRTHPTAEARP